MLKLLGIGGGSDNTVQTGAFKLKVAQSENGDKYRLPYHFPGAIILLSYEPLKATLTIDPSKIRNIASHKVAVTVIGQIRNKSDGALFPLFEQSKNVSIENVTSKVTTSFEMSKVQYPCPSYYGSGFDVRYTVRFGTKNVFEEVPVYVITPTKPKTLNPLITEIGILNLLHLTIALKDPAMEVSSCLVGVVFFKIVKMRITSMMLQIQREEFFDNGIIRSKLTSLVAQHELMDGTPVKGETIPIRIFLPGMKLWPFDVSPNSVFKVKYQARFLITDENGKKYYKDFAEDIFRYIK